MLTTLEDLVKDICNPINGFSKEKLNARDRSILYSMASQLRKALALTENQAKLAVKIIRDNMEIYESIEGLRAFLDEPKFKYPFRSVDLGRRIFLVDPETIGIRFPFNVSFSKMLDKIPSKKIFDTSVKAHTFKLNEDNIYKIIETFDGQGFEIDTQLYEWYQEIVKIKEEMEQYVPSAILNDNQIVINNCGKIAETYFNENRKGSLASDAILCKRMNLHFSEPLRNHIAASDMNPYLKKIVFHNKPHNYVQRNEKFTDQTLAEIIKQIDSYPILFFATETANFLDEFASLNAALNEVGIANEDMSVLFRSDTNTAFNQYVKDNSLNNLYGDNTKVVVLKYKIPKFLYKLNFQPSMIISNSLLYVHYSAQKLLENHPFVLYYTEHAERSLGPKIAKLQANN